jgi:NADPH:quinone reductase-like Zn-dependent oxidoreductase
VAAEVKRITGGKGCIAVYDGVGKDTFDVSLACLGKLGTMVSFGNASGSVRGRGPFSGLVPCLSVCLSDGCAGGGSCHSKQQSSGFAATW